MYNSKLLLANFIAAASAAGPAVVAPTYFSDNHNLPAYVSLSYETIGFPSFAGTKSSPNQYSVNLLQNIAKYHKAMPIARVGGNSQDRAIYDVNLKTATANACDADPTAVQCIGPMFFESYGAFPNTFYSHGFNEKANTPAGYKTLEDTVPLACKAIGYDHLETWEYGNEPDLFIPTYRPTTFDEKAYIAEWQNGTDRIYELLKEHCPDMATKEKFNFMAPSVSSPGSRLKPIKIFEEGLNEKNIVKQVSVHNYITGVNSPGVTLQNSLLSHGRTVGSVASHVRTANAIAAMPGMENVPYIMGEENSLYGGGRPGLSNVYGSALWVLDFVLQGASTGVVKRMHFHQSVGASYSAWVPTGDAPATNPSYYGKVAAADFLGDSSARHVVEVPDAVSSDHEAAYAGYDAKSGRLDRIAAINMQEFNSTMPAHSRPQKEYQFKVPAFSAWKTERLTAPGADVTTGVTYGGISYEYSTQGRPRYTRIREEVQVVGRNGILKVKVADSEAAVLTRF